MIFKKPGQGHTVSKRVRILAWLSVAGWACMLIALVIFHYGRPELEYGILRYFGVEVRQGWIPELRFWYVVLLCGGAGISLLSLIINRLSVQHHYRVRYNLVLLFLLSTTMLFNLFIDW